MACILVVEDEAMIRDIIRTYLTFSGFKVVTADDGIEALRLVHGTLPDLILMDMGLPKLNGWQTTQRLRERQETAGIPIIALTAYALDEDQQRAFSVGCNAFESKPIDFPHLLATINRLLSSVTPVLPRG